MGRLGLSSVVAYNHYSYALIQIFLRPRHTMNIYRVDIFFGILELRWIWNGMA